MKKEITYLLIGIIIIYLLLSFIEVSLNFVQWNMSTRIAFSVLFLGWYFLIETEKI